MSDIAIRVENLGKQYRIGGPQAQYKTIRESLAGTVQAPFRRLASAIRGQSYGASNETIWALKDVSFEVKRGEVVGVIGRNGAGKTTLLKILSRITEPTEGEADIHGRVGSLLEVGTGFHPELTGRENIFLSGAILGMKKHEIERKFDEIVAFAEIEKFMDTPVKRYSSGMYVRLAFAVAAHLEPEILLVDEVLAVGDAAFQKKCLGKMGNVASEGRTVLFVSHNMSAIQSLCRQAIWLDEGVISERGVSEEVVFNYLRTNSSTASERVWTSIRAAPGNDLVRLHRARVYPTAGTPSDPIERSTPLSIEIEYWNLVPDTYLNLTLNISTEQGIVAFSTSSVSEPVWHGRPYPMGLFRSTCYVPGNLLNSGLHWVRLLVVKNQSHILHRQDDILSFEISESVGVGTAWYGRMRGVVRPELEWSTTLVEERTHAKVDDGGID